MSGYDSFAGKYEDRNPIARFLVAGFYRGIAGLLDGIPVDHALEVGCGEGFSTARLEAILGAKARLEASDVDHDIVVSARGRNPGLPIQQESVTRLERADRSFDMVFCLEVLEHVEDPHAAFQELARVSSRWVLVSVPREPLWRLLNIARLAYVGSLGNTPGHLQHWSSRGFVKFVGRQATPVKIRRPLPWTQVLARIDD